MTTFNCVVCGGVAKARKGNANRYCSQTCVVVSGMRRVAILEQNLRRYNQGTLTDDQKREIARLRASGKQHKEIARLVGCTVEQSKHYSYASQSRAYAVRKMQQKRKLLAKKRADAQLKPRMSERIAANIKIAESLLAYELAAARAEAANMKPFKDGDLQW